MTEEAKARRKTLHEAGAHFVGPRPITPLFAG
jgi:hypothetical protein